MKATGWSFIIAPCRSNSAMSSWQECQDFRMQGNSMDDILHRTLDSDVPADDIFRDRVVVEAFDTSHQSIKK